jgi:hypothetical protein
MSPDQDEALSRLYRKAAVAEPSPAMDALILAAARRQAAEPLRPPRVSGGWRRWLAPVGIFATIVLTVSLTLTIEREQRNLLPAPAAVIPQPATVAPPPEAAKPALPSEHKAKAQKEVLPGRTVVAEPVAGPALALPAAPAQPAAEIQRSEIRRDEMRAAMPPPAPAATDRRERAMAKTAVRAPAEWIEEIRRLKREGHAVEAREQLEAFRRAYPDYRLPEDLKTD